MKIDKLKGSPQASSPHIEKLASSEGQITIELKRQVELLDLMDKKISGLDEKLKPILRVEPYAEGEKVKHEPDELVPVADEINSNNLRIMRAIDYIRFLAERVEL